jgi:putative tryptophan/tyrosine transport system substrate-binding protein
VNLRRSVIRLALYGLLILNFRAEAQQPKKLPRIGYLTAGSASVAASNVEAFRQGLQQSGYVEGKDILVEWRYADGKRDRLRELADELVRMKVDVIVTASTPSIRAVQQATKTIPIVMANVGDPVAQGFVASLARPGGNITGFTNLSPDVSTKRLELLKEASPKLVRVAIIWNAPQHGPAMKQLEVSAPSLHLRLQPVEVHVPDDLESAIETMTRERTEGFITLPNPLLRQDERSRKQIVEFALRQKIPSMHEAGEYVLTGGLMAYGPDERNNYRRAASHVDKILKGAKPAELPVEQPTKFELVINLKTAKQIGLTIPPNVLARADRIIK